MKYGNYNTYHRKVKVKVKLVVLTEDCWDFILGVGINPGCPGSRECRRRDRRVFWSSCPRRNPWVVGNEIHLVATPLS